MWSFKWEGRAGKKFDGLDGSVKLNILKYLKKVTTSGKPFSFGQALTSNKKGLWRYRVADYRIVCKIKDKELIILIIDIDHRSRVYK